MERKCSRLEIIAGLVALLGLAGCSPLDVLARDGTRLKMLEGQDFGRRLWLKIEGGTASQREGLTAAFRAELEDGNLFNTLTTTAPKGARVSKLEVKVLDQLSQEFGGVFADAEGFVARYSVRALITDRKGREAFVGNIDGVAYDDETAPDRLTLGKKNEIEIAAQRDAASKISEALRAIVEDQLSSEFDKVPTLKLAPGVGPLKLALVNVDVKRAHPSTNANGIAADLRSALDLAGPELRLINPLRVRQALNRGNLDTLTGLTITEKERKDLERFLAVPFIMLVTVRSGDEGVAMEASMLPLSGGDALTRVKSSASGIGALRIAGVRLVRALVEGLAKASFPKPPKGP